MTETDERDALIRLLADERFRLKHGLESRHDGIRAQAIRLHRLIVWRLMELRGR